MTSGNLKGCELVFILLNLSSWGGGVPEKKNRTESYWNKHERDKQ